MLKHNGAWRSSDPTQTYYRHAHLSSGEAVTHPRAQSGNGLRPQPGLYRFSGTQSTLWNKGKVYASCGCIGVIYFLPVSISKNGALRKINRRPSFQRCIFPLKYQDSDPFTGCATLMQLYAEPCWPCAQSQLHQRQSQADWEKACG